MTFSVIIPAYNVADYLEKCVDSVAAQHCGDWEMILIDDGSTDGRTGELCDTLALRHGERVRVVHQSNGGLGAARNAGIDMARGDYLVFLDSDDYIASQMLDDLRRRINATHCDIYTFGFMVDRDGTIGQPTIDCLPVGAPFTLSSYPPLLFSTPNAWNRIYRRAFFVESGVRYPDRVWFEDIRTTMKLFALADSIESVPIPYYFYLVRNGSITHNADIERNREIIDAFDDIICFYQEKGLYETYYNELCRLAIDHLYIAASIRVLRIDAGHRLLWDLRMYMDRHFPDYWKNPYRKELPRRKALAFSLLEHKQYKLLRLLFQIKG